MPELAYMPLFVFDYRARTRHLTFEERGLWFDLQLEMWLAPSGKIKDDFGLLCRKLGVRSKRQQALLAALITDFCETLDGEIFDPELVKQRDHCKDMAEKSSAHGRNAAQARWKKVANPDARAMPEHPIKNEIKTQTESNPHPRAREGANALSDEGDQGCRLPQDWEPTQNDREYAQSLGHDPDALAEDFRDYWHAKSGQTAVKQDWSAAWRRWCRHEDDAAILRSGGYR